MNCGFLIVTTIQSGCWHVGFGGRVAAGMARTPSHIAVVESPSHGSESIVKPAALCKEVPNVGVLMTGGTVEARVWLERGGHGCFKTSTGGSIRLVEVKIQPEWQGVSMTSRTVEARVRLERCIQGCFKTSTDGSIRLVEVKIQPEWQGVS
eukprot:scaffold18471_cov77-Attheya_sp.AAC.1